jgi:isocitrate dehydrogenase (NAD+)
MRHTITLIPGDGIGPEVSTAVQQIIKAAGVEIDWEETSARGDVDRRVADVTQSPAVQSILRTRVALKGPLATVVATGPPSLNVQLRKALDLYANVRPVKNLAGVKSRFGSVDILKKRWRCLRR